MTEHLASIHSLKSFTHQSCEQDSGLCPRNILIMSKYIIKVVSARKNESRGCAA